MKPGEQLARQLQKEQKRIRELGYYEYAHDLVGLAISARRAQVALDYAREFSPPPRPRSQ